MFPQTPNSRKRMICAMNGAHQQQTAEMPVRSSKRRQMSRYVWVLAGVC